MDISRRTWIAAVKLAVVISTLGALAAVAVSLPGLPWSEQVAGTVLVAVVAVVAFAASWVQTGRVRNTLPTR